MESGTEKINVAIADDHAIFREGLCEILSHKYDRINITAQAASGVELINKITDLRILPDICVLDVEMPMLNGFETLVNINKKWPQIRFLILSLYHNEFIVLKMLQYGANGYLTKTCKVAEVHQAIVSIYESSYYHSDIVANTLLAYLKDNTKLRPLIDISKREIEFLSYCSTDMTYKEIANNMNVSLRTIEGYYETLSGKLNIPSRVGLAIFSIASGIYKEVNDA